MPVSVKLRLSTVGTVTGGTQCVLNVRLPDGSEGTLRVPWESTFNAGEHIVLTSEPEGGRGVSPKRLRKAATKQERRSAEALGGFRQTGSGARPGHKGDGRVKGRFRIENKFTTSKRYAVDLRELTKIRAECAGLETPVFEIEFKEPNTLRPLDRWVLVPRKEWEKLANEASNDQ